MTLQHTRVKLLGLWALGVLLQIALADAVLLLPTSTSSTIACAGNSEFYDETILGCSQCARGSDSTAMVGTVPAVARLLSSEWWAEELYKRRRLTDVGSHLREVPQTADPSDVNAFGLPRSCACTYVRLHPL